MIDDAADATTSNRVLHKTIKAVTDDIEKLSFNTAIARMMEFTNYFTKQDRRPARVHGEVRAAAVAVRPAHGRGAVAGAGPQAKRWPTSRGRSTTSRCWRRRPIEMPVQINGKVRGKITVAADADQATDARRGQGRSARSPSYLPASNRQEIVVPDGW